MTMDQLRDILPEVIKVLAGIGFFAGVGKWVKKILDKRKIVKKQKQDDRERLIQVLNKLDMIEPQIESINVKLKRLTENQNLNKWMPLATSIRSNSGVWRINSRYSCGSQKPITRSTPARLYQERSKNTISPAVGRFWI